MASSIFNIVLGILALGLLIAVHEWGHYLLARLTGMRVIRFSLGFGPPIVSWTRKGIEYAVGWIPLGGYVQIFGMSSEEEGALDDERSFVRRPWWARFAVIFAGPLFSYVLGFIGYFMFFYAGQTSYERVYKVAAVVEGSAAAQAGLLAGDEIGMIDDKVLADSLAFGQYIDSHKGQSIVLKLDRGGKIIALTAALPAVATDKGVLGIRYGEKLNRSKADVSFAQALVLSSQTTLSTSAAILGSLVRMFQKPSEAQLGGPPEIVRQLKKSVERGFLDFIWMLAGLTVMFGLLNLLPVPALDGSKLFIMTIELIIRRDIPARFQLIFHGIGFVFLLAVMLLVSISDVYKMVAG